MSERALGLGTVGPAHWTKRAPAAATATNAAAQRQAVPAAAWRMSETPAAAATPARASGRQSPPVTATSTPASPAAPAQPSVALAQPPVDALPFASAPVPVQERAALLEKLDLEQVRGCEKCTLSRTRKTTVFGEGDPAAQLMFIGEGPGYNEDQSGRPFVGPAGELLNRMIAAMGLKREQTYIANIVKCRAFLPGPPAKDRAPAPEEVAACCGYLTRQVEIIRPRVIVTLGLPASQFVLQTKLSMSRLRGQWNTWHGLRVMPTWHPSYLLRREKEGDVEPKRQAWSDLQQVMLELGLNVPKKG